MNLQINLIHIAFLMLILNFFFEKYINWSHNQLKTEPSIHQITTLTMTASKTA